MLCIGFKICQLHMSLLHIIPCLMWLNPMLSYCREAVPILGLYNLGGLPKDDRNEYK